MAASVLVLAMVSSCVRLETVVRIHNWITPGLRPWTISYLAEVHSSVVAAAVVSLAKKEWRDTGVLTLMEFVVVAVAAEE